MDTNQVFLKACIASLAICATAAGAQTIYKQVDPEGRVMFTDRPNPEARVVASYETSRPARRMEAEPDAQAAQPAPRPIARPAPEISASLITPAFAETRKVAESGGSATFGEPAAAASNRLPAEAERAARTYTPLQSPLAFQVDLNESARRAQQEMHKDKDSAAGVLIVKPLPRDHEPTPRYEGFTTFYVMWAATFFLLAAGLLYVGWQVLRLILRSAFPRWQLGIG